MEPQELADIIDAALEDYDLDVGPPSLKLTRVRTFEEADLLTADTGLILTFADGSEFQVTIVKSK